MTYYYGNQSGGGFSLRFVIGIVIALAGIVMYFAHTSVNPTTGEKQHVSMSADQEIALGEQAAPQEAAQMGGEVSPGDPQAQLVDRVGNRVWHNSQAGKSPYPYHYHLLRDTQTVNAFALPGGEIFITKGLLDRLTTEGEVAGVLGHETGHVVERHVAQQMEKSRLGQMIVAGTAVTASDRQHGYETAIVAGLLDKMAQLRFSRTDESQADQKGLEFMTQAGYDPRAMLHVMQVLEEVSKGQGRPPQILVTHPYPEQRMRDIDAWIREHYAGGVPSYLEDPPIRIRG